MSQFMTQAAFNELAKPTLGIINDLQLELKHMQKTITEQERRIQTLDAKIDKKRIPHFGEEAEFTGHHRQQLEKVVNDAGQTNQPQTINHPAQGQWHRTNGGRGEPASSLPVYHRRHNV